MTETPQLTEYDIYLQGKAMSKAVADYTAERYDPVLPSDFMLPPRDSREIPIAEAKKAYIDSYKYHYENMPEEFRKGKKKVSVKSIEKEAYRQVDRECLPFLKERGHQDLKSFVNTLGQGAGQMDVVAAFLAHVESIKRSSKPEAPSDPIEKAVYERTYYDLLKDLIRGSHIVMEDMTSADKDQWRPVKVGIAILIAFILLVVLIQKLAHT